MAIDSKPDPESLKAELLVKLTGAHQSQVPLLIHLNADTTWLISLPYPREVTPPQGRLRYNILVDPWLQGPQSDVAAWFSTQRHAIQPSVQTIAELDSVLAHAEKACLKATSDEKTADVVDVNLSTYIDCVTVSHEFTDHCHQATLLELDPTVPVFASSKAAQLIQGWNHFKTVIDAPACRGKFDWRTTSQSPLPPFLGISRLITEGNSLYYHSALIICSKDSNGVEDAAQAIVYTPHGVEANTFSVLAEAKPAISTLAFLHGLHDVSITWSKQLNLGAHNGLKAQRLLRAKYWVGTHDEVKHGSGLIGPLLRRKVYTLKDALDRERALDPKLTDDQAPDFYSDMSSGQILLLA